MKIMAFLKYVGSLFASILLILVIVTTSTQVSSTATTWGASTSQAASASQAHRISNPAAAYCTDMGYAYQVVGDGAGGQTDTCTLPDGQVCSAWDFLEGKCGQAYSYCAKQGLGERTARDGQNPYAPDYAVCVDSYGKDVGQVTALFNLAPKLNQCGSANVSTATSTHQPAATPPNPAASNPLQTPKSTLPSTYDWRSATYNGITGDWTSPVKNQGGCGSCWAFAAVGQTEAVLNIYANNPDLDENLAEEYLVSDCSTAGSCCGGWHSDALDFIANQGIPDETCLPYASGSCGCSESGDCSCAYKNGGSCAASTCSQRCSDYGSRLSFIDDFGYVSSNQTAIKQALLAYGPLSVAMDIEDASWDSNLVLNCSPTANNLDHSVVIVGYNDAGNYWIVKNSWGSSWNGDGFFKVGYGQCQIEDYVYYAHAAPNLRTISGRVLSSDGVGISGVVVNGLPGNPTTDAGGYYSDHVANGWSGTVTPGKADYIFNPTTMNYSTVTSDQSNQNYSGHSHILLVDDDDNTLNVRSSYTTALTALGRSYDIWDTSVNSEPDASTLENYEYVIWFTGAKNSSATGPDSVEEAALTSYLNGGGRLLVSSQDYFKARGLTSFMSDYLGVTSATDDAMQTTVSGAGSAFDGLGPYSLSFTFSNSSDALNSASGAEAAFTGDNGNAAVDKNNGIYHSVFLGFPFEALPTALARQQVMEEFLEWGYFYQYLPLVTKH